MSTPGFTVVLPADATRSLELIDAQVAFVPPREVSGLVKALDSSQQAKAGSSGSGSSSSSHSHLKRVHKALRAPPPAGQDLLAILLSVGMEALAPNVQAILDRCHVAPSAVPVPGVAFPSDQTRKPKREVSAAHIEIGGRSRYIASSELLPEAIQQMWSYLVPLIPGSEDAAYSPSNLHSSLG